MCDGERPLERYEFVSIDFERYHDANTSAREWIGMLRVIY